MERKTVGQTDRETKRDWTRARLLDFTFTRATLLARDFGAVESYNRLHAYDRFDRTAIGQRRRESCVLTQCDSFANREAGRVVSLLCDGLKRMERERGD